MKTIQILKNEKVIKQFFCTEKMLQKYFDLAYDIAGGMYNGKDQFKIIIL
jgi:hypothetical protein